MKSRGCRKLEKGEHSHNIEGNFLKIIGKEISHRASNRTSNTDQPAKSSFCFRAYMAVHIAEETDENKSAKPYDLPIYRVNTRAIDPDPLEHEDR